MTVQLFLLPRTGRYNLLNTGVEDLAATYVSGAMAWVLVLVAIALFALALITTHRSRLQAELPASALTGVALPTVIVALGLIGILLFLENLRGLPMPVMLFFGLLGMMSYLASETRFGVYLYAIGENTEAARRAGIKVDRIKIAAFAMAGGLAAFAGILSRLALSRGLGLVRRWGRGRRAPAGKHRGCGDRRVSLFGGRGMVIGALYGALIIATVANGLNLMGVANEARLIVTGLLLIIAVSIDRGIEKLAGPG